MVNGADVLDGTPSARKGAWLAVDTSTPMGSVAVWRDGLVFEQAFSILRAHSELVLPAIDRALTVSGVAPGEVESFVLGSGPGSFTGVRIAASLAKGWSMARGTALYAYSSLLAVAAGCGVEGPVCALFDARRGEVYGACYDLADGREPVELLAPGAWSLPRLMDELMKREIEPVFVGEGAKAYRDDIRRRMAGARVLPDHLAVPRAASLLWLRHVAADSGKVRRVEQLEPMYVREWKVAEEGGRR
ncbi:MAG: tRNA (adenosine(37)-N6)-threonylcarbamoyltransferase complex dimerization subunit type 1 TsaB [Gemmatimonadota bacterium]|nr:MAG: tRNA (adenosine(37)-N6)-threonylcarbamoyltransferase complex dimerization subunit type 1 TsaB [Gemmatimonadota bacterium]